MSKKLVKCITWANRGLNIFTVSMEEFAAMAQGHVDLIYVHDQNNKLRDRLRVQEVLKKAKLIAEGSYYVVDYSPLKAAA